MSIRVTRPVLLWPRRRVTYRTVVCDDCGDEGEECLFRDPTDARRQTADKQGFARVGGRDLCSECAKKAKERK